MTKIDCVLVVYKVILPVSTGFIGLKSTQIDSQEPICKKSNDVRFVALRCIVFELSACENSAEFPAESGCKANDLT